MVKSSNKKNSEDSGCVVPEKKRKKKQKGKESTPKFSEIKVTKKMNISKDDMSQLQDVSSSLGFSWTCNVCYQTIAKNSQSAYCNYCKSSFHFDCVSDLVNLGHPNKFACQKCQG
jgi:hypothetical protein